MECFVPSWGISKQPCEASTTSWWTPFTCSLEVSPCYTILSTQSRFMNLGSWRRTTDATQIDRLHTESVTGTENTSDVVHRTHIVQYYYQWQLLSLLEFLYGQSLHLYGTYLSHEKKVCNVCVFALCSNCASTDSQTVYHQLNGRR